MAQRKKGTGVTFGGYRKGFSSLIRHLVGKDRLMDLGEVKQKPTRVEEEAQGGHPDCACQDPVIYDAGQVNQLP